ncbi:hypothetical protein [Actinomadura flavalba]|uniref:hypothetical protein n=1 Tax=Actinomadura flavalba TaxID=1120938 RepID=UPI00037EEB1E|nr:hypothetical protein [Actinomadura flavalba]
MGTTNSRRLAPWWTAACGVQTYPVRRVVLVVVHSVAAGERLIAAVRAVEGVAGVQVVFTRPPGPPDDRVAEFLAAADALTTPWDRAARERFDLVVAAGPAGVGPLPGALLLLPEVSPDGEVVDHHGRRCVRALGDLLRGREGRDDVVVVGLPHGGAVSRLERAAPDVGRCAVVVGDPVYDALLGAIVERDGHRERQGVRLGRRLGVVLSSRGSGSLLGRSPALLERIAAESAVSGDRWVCYVHPDVWVRHGRRQVLAWTGAEARERVRFLPLGQGWQGPVAAADFVIGDQGTATAYAAAAGRPVSLARPAPAAGRGSLAEAVGRYAAILDPAAPLRAQLDRAARPSAPVARRVTSVPGRSAGVLRMVCLCLLGITDSAPHRAEDV